MNNQSDIKNKITVDIISNIVHDAQMKLDYQGGGLLKALTIVRELIDIGIRPDKLHPFATFSPMQKTDQHFRHGEDEHSFHKLDFLIHFYD